MHKSSLLWLAGGIFLGGVFGYFLNGNYTQKKDKNLSKYFYYIDNNGIEMHLFKFESEKPKIFISRNDGTYDFGEFLIDERGDFMVRCKSGLEYDITEANFRIKFDNSRTKSNFSK